MAMTPEGRVTNLTGRRFGKLLVNEYLGLTPRQQAVWRALCDCGGVVVVRAYELVRGDTKSCGCLMADVLRVRNKTMATHQRSRSPEYRSWRAMKDRCLNPNSKDYKNYGGRGITIYGGWIHSFEQFLADMGAKPSTLHTLERIDHNAGYAPFNCRWATLKEQARNRRSCNVVDGKTIAQWADELGVSHAAVCKRLKKFGNVYGHA